MYSVLPPLVFHSLQPHAAAKPRGWSERLIGELMVAVECHIMALLHKPLFAALAALTHPQEDKLQSTLPALADSSHALSGSPAPSPAVPSLLAPCFRVVFGRDRLSN